ncbi:RNA recognition motif-containing protein, putative isoform 1 [Hibiscus syriacus]|uniref:RNA recognition motif-containing protein, putative isoform 1 n=1 Tax=Hibiscus syriacus TaxID=106335 RepID=A0A6A3CLM3_HIBSY|nr:RNA recognition motif-containing protein, putative isoform 1 [Hibiscus syriacus]
MVVKTTSNCVASENRTCVVLGGRGFLGRSLVARLLRLGGWIVRVADSSSHSLLTDPSSASDSLLSNALCSGQASFCHVDVRDTSQIIKVPPPPSPEVSLILAFNHVSFTVIATIAGAIAAIASVIAGIAVTKGADVVFYMEPTDLDIHDFYTCYMIIVQGAKNVINACRECRVRRLVYNSSADVVFDGSRDILHGDLSFICPGKFLDTLIDLKFHAEGLISRNSRLSGGLCAGKAFFITNLEPIMFWEFVSLILGGLGYPR